MNVNKFIFANVAITIKHILGCIPEKSYTTYVCYKMIEILNFLVDEKYVSADEYNTLTDMVKNIHDGNDTIGRLHFDDVSYDEYTVRECIRPFYKYLPEHTDLNKLDIAINNELTSLDNILSEFSPEGHSLNIYGDNDINYFSTLYNDVVDLYGVLEEMVNTIALSEGRIFVTMKTLIAFNSIVRISEHDLKEFLNVKCQISIGGLETFEVNLFDVFEKIKDKLEYDENDLAGLNEYTEKVICDLL